MKSNDRGSKKRKTILKHLAKKPFEKIMNRPSGLPCRMYDESDDDLKKRWKKHLEKTEKSHDL